MATNSASHFLGFLVVDESFLLGVKFNFATKLPADCCSMAGDMATASDILIAGWFFTALHAVQEFTHVLDGVGAVHFFFGSTFFERFFTGHDVTVIANFNPAFIAFKADWAGSRYFPVSFTSKACNTHYEFHTTGVTSVDGVAFVLILDRHGVVGIGCPLA